MQFEDLGYKTNYSVRIRSPRSVEVESVLDSPPSLSDGGFRSEELVHGDDDLMLRIFYASGKYWQARLETGPGGLSRVFSTPCPDVVCVVFKGQGYWLPLNSPDNYAPIPCIPIKEVIPVPKRQMVVLVDFVRLTAYGKKGLVWQSDEVSWDGIKIESVDSEMIRGFGYDVPNNREVEFRVLVRNGVSEGGSNPSQYKSRG